MAKKTKKQKRKARKRRIKRTARKALLTTAKGWHKISPLVHTAGMISSIASGSGVNLGEIIGMHAADQAASAIIEDHKRRKARKARRRIPKDFVPPGQINWGGL